MTRLATYQNVLDHFGLDLTANSTGAEDAQAVLDGDEACERFAVVTEGGELVYVYARDATIEAAQERAIANCRNDIYAEAPVAIVDLDTRRIIEPVWSSLQWATGTEILRGGDEG